MARGEQTNLVERFRATRGFLKRVCPHWRLGASHAGWVKAQAREAPRWVPRVIARLRERMRELPQRGRFGRWEAFAVDGSEIACPRALANQAAMGDVGKPDGTPPASPTTIFHLRLGPPRAFRVGPGTESERGHLRDMLGELPSGSLLVADAGFVGYDLCRELLERKRHFPLRAGGNAHLFDELGYER